MWERKRRKGKVNELEDAGKTGGEEREIRKQRRGRDERAAM